MRDYTILVIIGILAVIILDYILKTNVLRKKIFWIYWSLVVVIMLIVNGYLTWRPIVIYNESTMLEFRIFTIPIEDFFFGFSLLGMNIIIWEYLGKKLNKNNNG